MTNSDQARAVIAAGAPDILLDNMAPDEMRAVVAEHRARGVAFEASGGLSMADAVAVAATGWIILRSAESPIPPRFSIWL